MTFNFITNSRSYKIIFVFFVLLYLPSLLYVVGNETSMALGIFVSSMINFFLLFNRGLLIRFDRLVLFIGLTIFVVLYQVLILILGGYPVSNKTYLSALLIIYIILSSLFFADFLKRLDVIIFKKTLAILIVLSIALGFFSLFVPVNILGYSKYAKSIFPFSEPSHYAITVGPLLFAGGFLFSERNRLFIAASQYFLGFLYPSVLLLLFAVMMTLLYFKSSVFKNAISFIFIVSLGYLVLFTDFGVYFTERLTFSSETKNLTALVYMQGWEDMFVSLKQSNFFGIGFQNAGILEPSNYGELIYSVVGEYKNRSDGGFLSAKLISEFGVLGVLLIIMYLKYFFRSIGLLMSYVRNSSIFKYHPIIIFSSAIIVSFFIELFARGYGYFSPGVVLVVVSLFIIESAPTRSCVGRDVLN